MKKLYIIFFAICLTFISNAQFTTLLNFNVTNGEYPVGQLTYVNGKLYGLVSGGGAHDKGCLIRIDTTGSGYADLFDFNGANGKYPTGSLTLNGGKFYAFAQLGGANDSGCIFSIDTNGAGYKDLFDFNGTNGKWPEGSLTLSHNKLYGMTTGGGAHANGNVIAVDTNGGGFVDLLDFNITNGATASGDLTISGKVLYGMTEFGGSSTMGNIFEIDTDGTHYRDLIDFNGTDAQYPQGSLIIIGKKLYGMSSGGGNISSQGVVFSMDTNGTGFSDLLIFNVTNGEYPGYSKLLNIGNALYGMTSQGGAHGDGVMFALDTDGTHYSDMHDFNGANGLTPFGSLTSFNGAFYGFTQNGGTLDSGTVFKFRQVPTLVNNLENPTNTNITVYPNPSNGVLTFQINYLQSNAIRELQVYNMLGERVYSTTLYGVNARLSIDLNPNPSGIYLYRITTELGEEIATGKLEIVR